MCMNDLYDIVRKLSTPGYPEPERLAGEIHAQLHFGRSEDILSAGLHEYLMQFLDKLGALNGEINRRFLVPEYD